MKKYIDQFVIGFALFSMFFGAGNIIFSDFRLVKGKLTKQELRSRYLALYQFDDGRTGILNISDKLNKKIAELSK